ncbi:MAG TPA: ABC transporter substrate-binding protein [Stellaceae bacterium]|nr:ABC transporter substrate-binding protein [Stellaceae bacterium]
MRRRDIIALVGSAALTWPLLARAQQRPGVLRVGAAGIQPRTASIYAAFEQRIAELGYREGENFVFEYVQAASPTIEGYSHAQGELARRNVDIMMATGPEADLKAAIATAGTRPIVMIAIDFDPLSLGYIASLARPGGNITGLFLEQPQLAVKRLQFLRDSFPSLSGATVFWDQVSADQWRALERAASAMTGFHVSGIEFRDRPFDYEKALLNAAPQDRGALIVLASPAFALDRKRLPEFALQHGILSVFYTRQYVDVGGLFSYGPSFTEMFRRAADYVDRIAKGAKPGDLPVEEPTKYELVVNLKTANALGIAIPPPILVRADEVIE